MAMEKLSPISRTTFQNEKSGTNANYPNVNLGTEQLRMAENQWVPNESHHLLFLLQISITQDMIFCVGEPLITSPTLWVLSKFL